MASLADRRSLALNKAARANDVAAALLDKAVYHRRLRQLWRAITGLVGASGAVFAVFPGFAQNLGAHTAGMITGAAPFLLVGSAVVFEISEPQNSDRMFDYAFVIRTNVAKIYAALDHPDDAFSDERLQIAMDNADAVVEYAIAEWWANLAQLEKSHQRAGS